MQSLIGTTTGLKRYVWSTLWCLAAAGAVKVQSNTYNFTTSIKIGFLTITVTTKGTQDIWKK